MFFEAVHFKHGGFFDAPFPGYIRLVYGSLFSWGEVGANRCISLSIYHLALRKSSICLPFREDRHIYFTALPRLKVICSVISIHSTPEGCVV